MEVELALLVEIEQRLKRVSVAVRLRVFVDLGAEISDHLLEQSLVRLQRFDLLVGALQPHGGDTKLVGAGPRLSQLDFQDQPVLFPALLLLLQLGEPLRRALPEALPQPELQLVHAPLGLAELIQHLLRRALAEPTPQVLVGLHGLEIPVALGLDRGERLSLRGEIGLQHLHASRGQHGHFPLLLPLVLLEDVDVARQPGSPHVKVLLQPREALPLGLQPSPRLGGLLPQSFSLRLDLGEGPGALVLDVRPRPGALRREDLRVLLLIELPALRALLFLLLPLPGSLLGAAATTGLLFGSPSLRREGDLVDLLLELPLRVLERTEDSPPLRDEPILRVRLTLDEAALAFSELPLQLVQRRLLLVEIGLLLRRLLAQLPGLLLRALGVFRSLLGAALRGIVEPARLSGFVDGLLRGHPDRRARGARLVGGTLLRRDELGLLGQVLHVSRLLGGHELLLGSRRVHKHRTAPLLLPLSGVPLAVLAHRSLGPVEKSRSIAL